MTQPLGHEVDKGNDAVCDTAVIAVVALKDDDTRLVTVR